MQKKSKRRTYADRAVYLIAAVQKRRKLIRQRAIDLLGGQCQVCGYSRYGGALDFHHRNASDKRFGISERGYTRSWATVERELRGCVLLCANCHREVHGGIIPCP